VLASKSQLASLDDFRGKLTITRDPYSIAFLENIGAAPMQLAFGDVATGLQTGVADAAILSQGIIQGNLFDLFSGGYIVPEYKTVTGVTLASADWWQSLTAGEQRRLLVALEAAEIAAATNVREATAQAIALSWESGMQTVSWQSFEATDLRSAVGHSIMTNSGVSAEPILQLRDDVQEYRQQFNQESDTGEPERDGFLNQRSRVFFATNRRFDPGEQLLADRFANTEDPANELRCGELAAPGDGRIGKVSGEIKLFAASTVSEGDDCIGLISSAVRETGGKVLIHIHGYRNTFDRAVRSGLAFSRDAGSDGVVIVWSWPSKGDLTSYLFDAESVVISEPVISSFSRSLAASRGVDEVNFLAHSMGSRLVAALMRDDWIVQPSAVVLAAADVSRPFLEQAVKAAPSASVTLLSTEGDVALLASRKIHARPRAGQAKPLLLIDGMDTIDLTAYDQWWSQNHGHAFSEREVVDDLAGLFRGKWTAASRGLQPYPSPGSEILHYRIAPDG
jgi:hypothetical protein